MQILGNLFNAVLFASVVGGAFAAATLVCSRALRLALPLWAAAAAALLFCVPVLSPDVRLFSPEEQVWLAWYCAASRVWACGAAALLVGQGIRALLASRALHRRPACRDARLRAVCARCAAAAGLRRVPDLRSGAGEAAACVAGALRPVVLVNEAALAALAEEEVEAVLLHELTHIRRRHLLLERAADLACALCWFQPLAWLARRELALQCEIDCDRHALAASGLSRQAYAGAILRLLERSAVRPRRLSRGMGALRFSQTRRRIGQILAAPRRRRERWTAAALVLLLLLTFIGSARLSREHFYPYPAYAVGEERAAGDFFAQQNYKCNYKEDSMQTANIEILHVSKAYRNGTQALTDVSFSVGSGVFGLLGHNGAGKTTLLQALATVLRPTAGTIRVCGFDAQAAGDEVRARIGYLPQELAMYPALSCWDFVAYMASLKGVRGRDAVWRALEQVEMADCARRRIGQLSGGMRRRIGIAQALLGDPPVLIVDEPTAGLDPEERVRFRGVLSRCAQEGRTVLLSTHIVEDVHQICRELAVLRRGRLFFAGPAADLLGRVQGRVKTQRLAGEAALAALQREAVVLSTAYESQGLTARFVDEGGAFPQAEPVPATLEDAYVYCMGGKAHA